ncbi:hypothetical protein SELMODRAFT_424861 [Selaginella moellendorffii]|uniref:Uncharacterized protein n=1 Tax=Selaginella moellendorffii TaxID=88036 RepID=D8SR90_SELML|nr:hypothetical protein SELMODRAFT_424861 [Selaginella moellendorffii]
MLSRLAFIQEPLTEQEVASIVKERSSSLDNEAFLSVTRSSFPKFLMSLQIYLEMQKSGVKISPQTSPASQFLKRSRRYTDLSRFVLSISVLSDSIPFWRQDESGTRARGDGKRYRGYRRASSCSSSRGFV